jgi:hypothetical protein
MRLSAFSTVIIVVLVASALGCSITRPRPVMKDDYIPSADEKILSIELIGGSEIEFDKDGGRYSTDDRIIRGTSTAGTAEEISIDDVQSLNVDRINTGLSLTATFAGLLVMSLAIMYTLGMHAQWLSN